MIRDCQCPRARHAHGTRDAYRADGCRCTDCQEANRIYARRSRIRIASAVWHNRTDPMVDSCGIRRRLQALAAVGWAPKYIGERMGISQQAVNELRIRQGRIHRSIVDRIARVYDELWDQPPPGRNVRYVVNVARKNGWSVPMAWDDDTIDDPAAQPASGYVAPRRSGSGPGGDLYAELAELGCSVTEIAMRFGVQPESVMLALRRTADRQQEAS